MNFNSNTDRVYDIFLGSSLNLPIAFATWGYQDDEIFISNKLKSLISADENILDPYEFVKLMKISFGGFLNLAVEKVSNFEIPKSEFSDTVKSKKGDNFLLKLNFDSKKQIYVLTAEKIQKSENISSSTDSMLEAIINSLPIYVWQKNRDLQITYCNKKYSDALETTQDAVISKNLKLIPQSSRKDSTYVDQSLYSSKPKKFTEHIVVKGSRRFLEISESPFVGNNQSIGFAIDITDKEDIQKEYKNYKKQTEETLDNISVPIAIFDEKTKLIFANEAIIKLFSLESYDIYGNRNFSEILDVLLSNDAILSLDNLQDYKDKAAQLFSNVIDEPYHTSVHLKNGRTMHATITPNHGGGLMFLLEDISDKVALEREVNSISAVQQETLDHLIEGVIVFGTDNRIKITNPAINGIWNKNDITRQPGTHIRNFFEASSDLFDSPGEVELWISKLVNMAAQRVEFSDAILLKSGKTIDYSYVPLPDGLNLIRFYDASDRANLERALKEKTDIISQIEKLKGNLISNISYELRSPLNTIMGFADILEQQYFGELNDKQMEYCKGISNSVTRLTEVVSAIINLANIEAGQLKLKYSEVNLLEFINDTIDLFASRAKSQNIEIKTNFDDPKATAFFDEQSMKQVIFQIVSKAVKMTPSGGEVNIDIAFPESNSDYFELSVSDTGIGMSEEELDKNRKMLLNDMDGGAVDKSIEFGLLLANNIVRLHNGKILIDSKNGEGSITKCILPIKQFLQ